MNWKQRIERAKKNGKFTPKDQDIIDEYYDLISEFGHCIWYNNFKQAEKTYKNVITTLEEQLKSQAIRIAALEAETAEQESKIELLITQLGQLREVNASLLDKNAELQRQVKEHENLDKLLGEQK